MANLNNMTFLKIECTLNHQKEKKGVQFCMSTIDNIDCKQTHYMHPRATSCFLFCAFLSFLQEAPLKLNLRITPGFIRQRDSHVGLDLQLFPSLSLLGIDHRCHLWHDCQPHPLLARQPQKIGLELPHPLVDLIHCRQ